MKIGSARRWRTLGRFGTAGIFVEPGVLRGLGAFLCRLRHLGVDGFHSLARFGYALAANCGPYAARISPRSGSILEKTPMCSPLLSAKSSRLMAPFLTSAAAISQ